VSSANPAGARTTRDKIPTPNLDRLAAEGTRLENYYVQPVCSPTRGTILSGRYPSHTGIGPDVIRPSHPYGMPLSEKLLPQHFKEAGYATHMVGKWHLGLCDARLTPTLRGFDSFLGYLVGSEFYYTHTRRDGLDFRNGSVAGELAPPTNASWGRYSTTVFRDAAARIVRAHDASAPLFLYLPLQAVHAPLQAPASRVRRFRHISDKARRVYAAMVSAMDDAVGAVVAAFEERGMWNDTLLVFSTDNGGHRGDANNYPLRGSVRSAARPAAYITRSPPHPKGTRRRRTRAASAAPPLCAGPASRRAPRPTR